MICEICGATDWHLGKLLTTCNKCGIVRAADQYFNLKHQHIYSSDYYSGIDYFDYQKEKPALQKNFFDRLQRIRKYLKKGQLLEIGSAYGFFLELAKKNFIAEGVECNTRVARDSAARLGIKIWAGQFENIDFKHQKYQAIVALDTIEHVRSPFQVIQKCHQLLQPGGYLFIETGNIESFLARLQREKWRLVHPPEHLWYFSPRTLTLLLEKTGFRVLNVERVNFWRTGIQTLYRLFPQAIANLNPNLVRLLTSIYFPLNTHDLFFLTAQKI